MTINFQRGKVEYIENMWVPYSAEAGDEFIGRCQVQLAGGITVTPIANGAARIAIGSDEDDEGQIYGPLAYELDESTYATLYARLRITDVDVSSVFIGFTDQLTAAEVPIEDEDGTLGTNATDAVGILLEGEQDETWQTVGVQNDVDNAQAAIGTGTGDVTVPDASDNNWFTAILELEAAKGTNTAIFRVHLEDANGNLVACAERTSFFRTSVALCPVISADGRASAYNVDVAEFGWSGNRGSFFD